MNATILTPNAGNATNIQSALALSGKNFQVVKEPLVTQEGWAVKGKYRTRRTDKDGPESILGIVGNRYEVQQLDDVFSPLQEVVDLDHNGNAHFDSILETGGGSRVAASVDLGRSFDVVPGDTHKMFLTAIATFDGSSGTRYMAIDFRLRCFNAVTRAIRQARDRGFITTIPHTASGSERIRAVREMIAGYAVTADELKETYTEMAERQLTRALINEIVATLFPLPKPKADADAAWFEAAEKRVTAKRDKFLEIFESNDDGEFQLVKNTAYNIFNAYTEYTDHYEKVVRTSGKTGLQEYEIRQERSIFGSGAESKDKALDIILAATQFAPRRALPVSVAMTANFTSNTELLDAILN